MGLNKAILLIFILCVAALSGCASLHDDKGWEHSSDPATHETPDSGTIFEHRH